MRALALDRCLRPTFLSLQLFLAGIPVVLVLRFCVVVDLELARNWLLFGCTRDRYISRVGSHCPRIAILLSKSPALPS